jgi:glutathione S-transferase
MAEEITLYTNPFSRGRIAHWMLEEIGAPYTLELVRLDKEEQKAPSFLQLNPMGKLPTIVHRGTVVTEGAAICAYLADAFPEVGLAPDHSDPRRGTYLRWLFFGAGCVEPAMVDKLLDRPAGKPSALGYGSYEDTLRALELAITPGPFVLGDRFSAADVYLGSQIAWGLQSKGLEPRPAFQAYIARFEARPAFKRFSAQCAELSKQLQR